MLKCPFSYKKWQILHPRINVLIIGRQVLLVVNLIVISFCKTIYFVTLACFSVILIYPDSLFSYFTLIILSVMTAVTFPLRPPRLAFAICWWRWQNDVHEIKYSVSVCAFTPAYLRGRGYGNTPELWGLFSYWGHFGVPRKKTP